MKQYKAILLDWDDTIGDWSHAEIQAQKDLYEEFSLGEWFADFETWFGSYHAHNLELWAQYGNGEITRAFLQRDRFLYPVMQALGLNVVPQSIVELADKMGERFLQLTNKYFSLLPDAERVIAYLSERYPIAILSNGFREVQYYKLAHSGLRQYFKEVLISEEVGVNKPQVGIFEQALKRLGVSRNEALMIGDSYTSDIVGAKAARIDQLWICKEADLHDSEREATYKVTRLADVTGIV